MKNAKKYQTELQKTQEMLYLFLTNLGEKYFAEMVKDEQNDDQDYQDFATIIISKIKDNKTKNEVEKKFNYLGLV